MGELPQIELSLGRHQQKKSDQHRLPCPSTQDIPCIQTLDLGNFDQNVGKDGVAVLADGMVDEDSRIKRKQTQRATRGGSTNNNKNKKSLSFSSSSTRRT